VLCAHQQSHRLSTTNAADLLLLVEITARVRVYMAGGDHPPDRRVAAKDTGPVAVPPGRRARRPRSRMLASRTTLRRTGNPRRLPARHSGRRARCGGRRSTPGRRAANCGADPRRDPDNGVRPDPRPEVGREHVVDRDHALVDKTSWIVEVTAGRRGDLDDRNRATAADRGTARRRPGR
jgi:hypothetical protein